MGAAQWRSTKAAGSRRKGSQAQTIICLIDPKGDYQFEFGLIRFLGMDKDFKDQVPNSKFCVHPWTQLAVTVTGEMRLCCHTPVLRHRNGEAVRIGEDHGVAEAWNSESMKTVRKMMLAGQLPDLCRRCISQEEHGIESRRQKVLRTRPSWASDVSARINATDASGHLALPPTSYDLRLGNTCNLKCVMCRPQLSSSWVNDARSVLTNATVPPSGVKHLRFPGDNRELDYSWHERSDLTAYLRDHVRSARQLYFAGGEPMLAKQHWRILETCISAGVASGIELSYDTNGTQINQKSLQLWEQFKSVDLRISVDGLGEKFEYIREGAAFTQIQNLMSLLGQWSYSGLSVRIIVTMQILNILDITDIYDWFWSLELSRNRKHRVSIVWSFVEWPQCLSVGVLPEAVRSKVLGKIERACQEAKAKRADDSQLRSLEDLRDKLSFAFSLWPNARGTAEFVQYADAIDLVRGKGWRRIFPELKGLIE